MKRKKPTLMNIILERYEIKFSCLVVNSQKKWRKFEKLDQPRKMKFLRFVAI